jgi:hypothetical protein
MKHFYEITNRVSGAELGTYEADSEEEALDLLAQDAGYADDAAMCAAVPRGPRELEIKCHSVVDDGATGIKVNELTESVHIERMDVTGAGSVGIDLGDE